MIILVLVLLGLCLGSFINALVWRIHETEQRAKSRGHRTKKKTQPSALNLSIWTGRSMCVHCHHELAAKDLVPVLSWLSLGGKCRYCHRPISWQYPAVELLMPVLFIISYVFWPISAHSPQPFALSFSFWLVFLVGFIALAIYDLKWFLLPNRIIFPLFGLAVLQLIFQLTLFKGGWGIFLSAFWGLVVGGGIFYALFQLSGGTWIGGGDVKLGWLLGVLLGGPAMSLLMIFVASLLGTVVSFPLLVVGKAGRKTHLPFGPFLLASAVIVRLFGAGLIAWYKRQLGV